MIRRINSFIKTPIFKILSAVCVLWLVMIYFMANGQMNKIEECGKTVEMIDGVTYDCWKTKSYDDGITYIYQCDETIIKVSSTRINVIK